MHLSRILLAALAFATVSIPANAQSWPTRSVKFVLPLGPGAGADISGRMLAERLQKRWGQAVVIENRPGGDGVIAIGAFQSVNDDHTFLYGPAAAFAAHPFQHSKLPYEPADIVPIVRVSNTLVVVSVPSAMDVKSMADLVALVKRDPGKYNWAAVTGLNDYQFQAFVKVQGLDIKRVPYRDPVQAANDLAEGRIQAFSSAFAIIRPQIEAGKARPLALTNSFRPETFMDLPIARAAGYPELEFDGLVGVFATRAAPGAVRDRIEKDVLELMGDKEVIDRLTATGQFVNPGTGRDFAESMAKQRAIAGETAKVIGLKPTQ